MSARKRKFTTLTPALGCLILCCLMPCLANAQIEEQLPEVIAAHEAGIAALQAEDWEGAIAQFDKAIAAGDNTFAMSFFGRGEAYRELEDYQSAIANYTSATQIDDSLAQAYNGRGICLRELGSLDIALNDFQTANELDRRDGSIAANLGDLLVNQYRNPTQAMPFLGRCYLQVRSI